MLQPHDQQYLANCWFFDENIKVFQLIVLIQLLATPSQVAKLNRNSDIFYFSVKRPSMFSGVPLKQRRQLLVESQ